LATRLYEAWFAATEAELAKRPPDLADWVAAAVRSQLGNPAVIPDDALMLEFYFPTGEIVELDEDLERVASKWQATVRGGAFGYPNERTRFTTPAELRAALDRTAGGGS
jgi:hypothetical protein